MNVKKFSSDAYEWAYRRYVKNNPELVELVQDIAVKAAVARQIHDIRNRLRMSRDDLAELSGLTSEVVEDLEECDYDGSWEEAIQSINRAFHYWFTNVVLPAAQMKPEDYSVKVVNA